jgi:ABC-type nitrate/sulfonate/bicarbonate transport system permease component
MHYLMPLARRIDRTRILLAVVFLLYLWDVAFFVGLRNPDRVPHPFSLFRTLGDIEVLRGFPAMLREVIFSFASGSLIGIAIGALVLYSSSLSALIRSLLSILLWLPLIVIFAVPAPLVMGIIAVALCACYYYIAARSPLGLKPFDAWIYTAREALLQALLVCLLSQLWVSHWQWSSFTMFMKVGPGLKVFATLVGLMGLINWCFRSDFQLMANTHAAILSQELESKKGFSFNCFQTSAIYTLSLLAIVSLVFYLSFGSILNNAKIWRDMGLSLLEVIGGIVLGGLVGQGVFVLLSRKASLRKLVFPLLPLMHISAIALWLIVFVVWLNWFRPANSSFLYFWHKVIAVGCLTFFPLVQSLWGFRDRPILYRVLIAIHEALPIAFVAMFFGEAYGATQGLGFFAVVASTTQQSDKAIAVCFLTFVLMVGLSVLLRWAVITLYSSEKTAQAVPA